MRGKEIVILCDAVNPFNPCGILLRARWAVGNEKANRE
jgi:hypothetical protein